ncbi:DNA helicase [Microbacterium sp. cx-55]|uniref:DNA helicase n=1 Tax=unclassified Microbacterium TaxID=2609290 RepID=UPI001CC15B0F|nr:MULTISPECIES: DNA helicase [unclassified Microbacterium]MBZ4487200.1 DNA helicase [Microbacterium sp. cx-55]MCC4908682.1 DNA helicase [Microbacterium sp. cx-59]UGB35225.1 DNA helicase [Microbacterium sp. cx-55]
MSLSRKRKKELRKLQNHATKVWETQQVLVGEAADVAREAGRQIGHYNREQIVPAVHDGYDRYAAPYVDRGVKVSRKVLSENVVPAAGALVGGALSVWDAANDTRSRIASGRGISVDTAKYQKKAAKYSKKATRALSGKLSALEPQKKGIGAGGVIAILLGVVAAGGVLYAAWQTLRADDELWVADDPLRAPDA